MKNKIITAIGNEKIYRRIKENTENEIICKDILYEDGIFEVLEKENSIDFILISEEIIENNNFEKIIKKINKYNNKIKIIILLKNKREKLEENKNVKYININNYVFKNIEKELMKNKETNLENKNFFQKNDEKNNKKIKIISIAGGNGVGKSVFTASLANSLEKKILIIDFDFFNNSIHTLFGVKRGEKEIIKINKNIDLISTEEIYCKNKYKIKIENIIEIIERIKNNYEYIFIDTSSEIFLEYTKEVLKYSDSIIFLIKPNILELKKSINLLRIYKENWNIENSKIKIVINKIGKNSIDKKINKKIFSENDVIGEIKYSEIYDFMINKNMKNIKGNIFIKNKYKKILNKIILKNKIKKYKGEKNNAFRRRKIKFF